MSLSGGGTDLSYHLNKDKLNSIFNVMSKNSNEVKMIANSGVKDTLQLYVNNGQCLGVKNSPTGAMFTVPFSEGLAGDSFQGLSNTPSTSFVHDQRQSYSYLTENSNHKYDQVSSTFDEEIVPMAQGTNPFLLDYQKALHNVDNSQVIPIKVDFTNISLYCPVQNTVNTVVYLHDIMPNKGGAFFYYVQYLDCINMCYLTNWQEVPDGFVVFHGIVIFCESFILFAYI